MENRLEFGGNYKQMNHIVIQLPDTLTNNHQLVTSFTSQPGIGGLCSHYIFNPINQKLSLFCRTTDTGTIMQNVRVLRPLVKPRVLCLQSRIHFFLPLETVSAHQISCSQVLLTELRRSNNIPNSANVGIYKMTRTALYLHVKVIMDGEAREVLDSHLMIYGRLVPFVDRFKMKFCNKCYSFKHLSYHCPSNYQRCFSCGDQEHTSLCSRVRCCRCGSLSHMGNDLICSVNVGAIFSFSQSSFLVPSQSIY